jgi:hypothetical protein
VFRFIWENRKALKVRDDSYIEVESVLPSIRIGPDGFVLHETVAVYVQILTIEARELKRKLRIAPPAGVDRDRRIRVFGGGTLIFDEYGQLKYHIPDRLDDLEKDRQATRLQRLADIGFFDKPPEPRALSGSQSFFAQLHRRRMAE